MPIDKISCPDNRFPDPSFSLPTRMIDGGENPTCIMYLVAWSDDGKFLLLNMGKQYHGETKFVAWGIGSFLAEVPETDEILLIDGLVLKV